MEITFFEHFIVAGEGRVGIKKMSLRSHFCRRFIGYIARSCLQDLGFELGYG